MLWQLYVRREANAMGFKSIGTCDNASSGNPDLPPHMRKCTVIDDTGSVVYKLGLSPRPPKLRGAAALRQKQEQSLLVPRTGPMAPPPPWVTAPSPAPAPAAASAPCAPPDALEKELGKPRDVLSDYTGMSAALSRAIIEHRLKTAQEREERLELILAKQRGRREQVQKMLDRFEPSPAPAEPKPDLAGGAKAKDPAPAPPAPPVKSASHLKRGPLAAAFQMA